jgi:hypothetical protein
MSFLFATTTFKKNGALRVHLQSFVDHGYAEEVGVFIADDNDGEAEEVYKEFQPQFKALSYSSGSRGGIAKNKNRCLKFFLEQTNYENIILFDDDTVVKHPGFCERLLLADQDFVKASPEMGKSVGQINTYLAGGGPDDPSAFLNIFPPQLQTEHLYFCSGSQGMGVFFTRQAIELVGYFDTDWKNLYGFEHTVYSARHLKASGRQPQLFPVLKNSPKFIDCIYDFPNQYDESADYRLNDPQYKDKMEKIYAGVGLHVKNPGI